LNSGRYEEALASFTKAQNFNVDNNESTAIHYYKGLSLWHLKRYNEALNEFTNAVNFPESPYYVDSLEAMGRIYFHLGDKIKAVESLKRGLERASYDQRQRIENLITTIDNL
jgi:tetratricopeptide (TPR) repeat protein